MARNLSPELERWAVEQALAGQDPDTVLQTLCADGWKEQEAIDAVEAAVRNHLMERARETGSPPPARVPAAFELNCAAVVDAGDRRVQVLAQMLLPRVVVLGGLLSDAECDALVESSRSRLSRSTTVDPESGEDREHAHRTSHGTCFARGEDALCVRIETRIARLLDWPVDHGEGLQILRYGSGGEYRPHYDYFDPQHAGSEAVARRGGQRVATVVMYLNTPVHGGATVFPDVRFEVAAVKGNAVFFSYDRPHPMTRSLHAGAPVREGEKWIATKWLRERPYR